MGGAPEEDREPCDESNASSPGTSSEDGSSKTPSAEVGIVSAKLEISRANTIPGKREWSCSASAGARRPKCLSAPTMGTSGMSRKRECGTGMSEQPAGNRKGMDEGSVVSKRAGYGVWDNANVVYGDEPGWGTRVRRRDEEISTEAEDANQENTSRRVGALRGNTRASCNTRGRGSGRRRGEIRRRNERGEDERRRSV